VRTLIVCIALAALSCQGPLVFFISNGSEDPLEVTLFLDAPLPSEGENAPKLNLVARSDLDRFFGEPELLPATDTSFDQATHRIRVTIPPQMALRVYLATPHVATFRFDPSVEVEISGVAGTVRLTGQQVYRHMESRRAGPTLEYGAHYRDGPYYPP
jgi:hypothetical protein